VAAWVKAYDRFTMVAFITFILQAALFSLAALFGWAWAWWACIPSAISALLLAAMCFQADHTPFTAGANDNASAVGMVLTLAGQLSKLPLENTRVYAVVTGCEEVQHYGMIDFYRRHRAEMKAPRAVVFEMLGCVGPAWELQEGIIVPFKSDPNLVALAERLSAAHPEWKAYPTQVSGGNSELSDAVRFKVPAITMFGLTPTGGAPHWHQPSDTFDKMNPDVLERTWEFTQALVHAIDCE
jgi:Zn-dependent M28 family amino/carboxypeptidase